MSISKIKWRSALVTMFLSVGMLTVSGTAAARSYHDAEQWNSIEYSQGGDVKSRSEVIREIKRRYNAEVLRIGYDDARKVYRVRVLMPNGKVRNLTVSARR